MGDNNTRALGGLPEVQQAAAFLKKLREKAHNGLSWFFVFLATLTGYIPIHFVRLGLYQHLFMVDIPSDSVIYWRCRFFEPSGVHIGHHSIVGNDTFLDGRTGLFIGHNVNIAAETRIYTVEHNPMSPDFAFEAKPVNIGDWVYIGPRVTVLPGVRIGTGAVVAAGAVVTKDVEPWTMVGGIPARFIKRRPVVRYTLDTKKGRVPFQ